MSRGGVTPEPTPTPTPAIEIWANEECTVRPTSGQLYNDLYAKLNRSYQFGAITSYGDGAPNLMDVFTPDEDYPDDTYSVTFSQDWVSTPQDEPLAPGVYSMHTQPGGTVLYATIFDYGSV